MLSVSVHVRQFFELSCILYVTVFEASAALLLSFLPVKVVVVVGLGFV